MAIKLLCCTGSLDGGGSERQLWQLAVNLPQDQFATQLYLIYKRGPFLQQLPSSLPVHAFSDLSFHSRIPGGYHRSQVNHLSSVLSQQHIDVVYDRTYHMTLVTGPACSRVKVPRVSVIVSPPSQDFAKSNERFKWFKYRILRNAYNDPRSRVIAVSSAVADDAAAYFRIPRDRFQVVPSPVHIDAVREAANQPLASDSANNQDAQKKLRVVVIARLTSEKGHALMIVVARAWDLLRASPAWRPIQIDFIGDGPLLETLKQQVAQDRLADHIRFHGFQTNPYPWIQQADVVCIPSLYEGLPNVALEAMALEKPVIATDCSSSLQSLFGSNQERGALVPIGDAEKMSKEILNQLEHPELSAQRCQNALQWIEQNHSLRPWLETMMQLFREVCSTARR